MVNEMKVARETQLRPYIIVDFEFYKIHLCDMVIKNVGNGPAFDVKIKFEPDIVYREPDIKLSDLPIFQQMAFFPAGKEIRFFFKSMIGQFGEDAQNQFNVNLGYKDSGGKIYDENLSLDLTLYKNLAFLGVKDFDDLVKTVERIAQSNDRLEKQVGRLTEEVKGGLKIDTFEIHSITQASKENILAKLLEFKNIWDNLYAEDIKHQPSYFKTKFKTLAFQIVNFVSLNTYLEESFIQSSLKVASEIFELSGRQFYADGGASVQKFNEHGRAIIALIDEIVVAQNQPRKE